MQALSTPGDILDFWFVPAGTPGHGQARAEWFRKDAAFDASIRARFLPTVEAALAGELQSWASSPAGSLALLLLLDQLPRNLYRDSARAFAGDAQARALAGEVIAHGWDQAMQSVERVFVYLPFEHSEALPDQERALTLFGALAAADPSCAGFLDYARRHHAVIARFGRFPHRNAVLGRADTAEESTFLAQPGSRF